MGFIYLGGGGIGADSGLSSGGPKLERSDLRDLDVKENREPERDQVPRTRYISLSGRGGRGRGGGGGVESYILTSNLFGRADIII